MYIIDIFLYLKNMSYPLTADFRSGHSTGCSGCQECVAVECLLSMGQGSPKKHQTAPVAVEMQPNAKVMEPFWSQGVHPPTPPPSESGSLSPPQSEDSWDSNDTPRTVVALKENVDIKQPSITLKRKSRLAQVRDLERYKIALLIYSTWLF